MLILHVDTSWTAGQDHLPSQQGTWFDAGFPFLDAPFLDEHAQAEFIDPSQSVPISTLDELQTLGDPASLLFYLDPSLHVPIPSAVIGPSSSHRGQEYDEILGNTAPRFYDGQWNGQGAGSTSSPPQASRILIPSTTRSDAADPGRVDYFNTENGLFVDPQGTWLSPSSLEISSKGYPQASEAANIVMSGREFPDVNAEQNRTLEASFNQISELAVPPLAGLLDLELLQQGTEDYQQCDDEAHSTKNAWFNIALPDTVPDHNGYLVMTQKAQSDRPHINPNIVMKNSETTKEFAPTLVPTRYTTVAKTSRRQKAPNANLTLADGLGKFATSRVRKAFSEDRRQEVAMTRRVGACFRCKVAKVTVRSFGKHHTQISMR